MMELVSPCELMSTPVQEQRLTPDVFHHRAPSAACAASSTPPAPIRSTSDAINTYWGTAVGDLSRLQRRPGHAWSPDAAALLAGHCLVELPDTRVAPLFFAASLVGAAPYSPVEPDAAVAHDSCDG
jgi:hypothetical protein